MAQVKAFSLGGLGAPCCCGGGSLPGCSGCVPAHDLTFHYNGPPGFSAYPPRTMSRAIFTWSGSDASGNSFQLQCTGTGTANWYFQFCSPQNGPLVCCDTTGGQLVITSVSCGSSSFSLTADWGSSLSTACAAIASNWDGFTITYP